MATNSPRSRLQQLVSGPRLRWARNLQLWIELFAASNLAVLAADIYLAHSVNSFRRPAEFLPLYFSILAPILLGVSIVLRWVGHRQTPWRFGGYCVGWFAILMGLAGVLLHLQSRFFLERTVQSLTYAAPFAAPLAYTGLGFLLVMNRMVDPRGMEWARWVMFLALGGFFGNFVLSLTDHATNGFFDRTEWIPVFSAAVAVGFLIVPILGAVPRGFLDLCMAVMMGQILVGVLGFWFHLRFNLVSPGHTLLDKLVNGAPPMAPLLFPNLAALAMLGLWALIPHLPERGHSWLGATYAWIQAGKE